MSRIAGALLAGTVFGLGLAISGMINPAKVLGFLDFFGSWDPTLAFVMGGAVAVTALGFRWILGRGASLSGDAFSLPTKSDLDPRLLAGAALFGLGWGLSGFCPGPGLSSLTIGLPVSFLFVGSMLAGMALHGVWERRTEARRGVDG